MSSDAELLTSIHKALIGFNKRAERVYDEILELSFVDSAPLFDLLSSNNDGSRPLAERASTLVVDVLNALYDELYSVALKAIR
jgi:hypothetical protein